MTGTIFDQYSAIDWLFLTAKATINVYLHVYLQYVCSSSTNFKSFYMDLTNLIAFWTTWQNFVKIERHQNIKVLDLAKFLSPHDPLLEIENGVTNSH